MNDKAHEASDIFPILFRPRPIPEIAITLQSGQKILSQHPFIWTVVLPTSEQIRLRQIQWYGPRETAVFSSREQRISPVPYTLPAPATMGRQ